MKLFFRRKCLGSLGSPESGYRGNAGWDGVPDSVAGPQARLVVGPGPQLADCLLSAQGSNLPHPHTLAISALIPISALSVQHWSGLPALHPSPLGPAPSQAQEVPVLTGTPLCFPTAPCTRGHSPPFTPARLLPGVPAHLLCCAGCTLPPHPCPRPAGPGLPSARGVQRAPWMDQTPGLSPSLTPFLNGKQDQLHLGVLLNKASIMV